MTQLDLTKAVGKHPAYTNQVLTGGRRPSPEYVDLVANALGLSDKERVALHRAAAHDHGFKLDLTRKQGGAGAVPSLSQTLTPSGPGSAAFELETVAEFAPADFCEALCRVAHVFCVERLRCYLHRQ